VNKYFVVFRAECDSDFPRNDVVEYQGNIVNIEDVRSVERLIERKWFDDGREIVLINFRKLSRTIR
jgi:hypothetical protein